jgi:hypothetical protein
VHKRVCSYVYLFIYVCVCVFIYIYAYTCIYIYMYIYMYTYIYIYTHIYMHIYTYTHTHTYNVHVRVRVSHFANEFCVHGHSAQCSPRINPRIHIRWTQSRPTHSYQFDTRHLWSKNQYLVANRCTYVCEQKVKSSGIDRLRFWEQGRLDACIKLSTMILWVFSQNTKDDAVDFCLSTTTLRHYIISIDVYVCAHVCMHARERVYCAGVS